MVNEDNLVMVIFSFCKGLAVGPDGLSHQHLVDLTSFSTSQNGRALYIYILPLYTTFTNFVLAGDTIAHAHGISARTKES